MNNLPMLHDNLKSLFTPNSRSDCGNSNKFIFGSGSKYAKANTKYINTNGSNSLLLSL